MRKQGSRQHITFAFAKRADLFLTRHTADALIKVLELKTAFRKRWQEKSFRDEVSLYGAVGATTFASGVLVSLVSAFWI
jgi:hypothetical protein